MGNKYDISDFICKAVDTTSHGTGYMAAHVRDRSTIGVGHTIEEAIVNTVLMVEGLNTSNSVYKTQEQILKIYKEKIGDGDGK